MRGVLMSAAAAVCALAAAATPLHAADFKFVLAAPGRNAFIVMDGRIVEGDWPRCKEFAARIPTGQIAVVGLSGPGGDLLAALEIGSIIRSADGARSLTATGS